MIFITSLFFLLGCTLQKDAEPTAVTNDTTPVDTVASEPESQITEPEEREATALIPTHVFFYVTTVIDENGSMICYPNSEGEDYCGVFRYFLADTSKWSGLDDYTNVCHIVHALHPDKATTHDATKFTEAGDWVSWTMDAGETYFGKSDSCSDIPNEHESKVLIGQFSTQNFSFGFGPTSEEHLQSFKDHVEEQIASGYDVPAWDTYWQPNIISQSLIAGGTTELVRPNYGFAFHLDTTNTPVSIDDKLQFIEMQDQTGAVRGYYRSKTWWGYSIDNYTVSTDSAASE